MMLEKEKAIAIATKRLQIVYEAPELLKATHTSSLKEFDDGQSGWRVWFHVKDSEFGAYDRPVEVCDETKGARLVRILL